MDNLTVGGQARITLPLDGGGLGWGWCTAGVIGDTPLPNPPPGPSEAWLRQVGGRGARAERIARQ